MPAPWGLVRASLSSTNVSSTPSLQRKQNWGAVPSQESDFKITLGLLVHKILFVCILIMLAYSSRLFAQTGSPMDQACRAQAKEVALQTYNSCMTEVRQKRLDNLKNEYESKIQDLKSQYERELQKLSIDPKKSAAEPQGLVPETVPSANRNNLKNQKTSKGIQSENLNLSERKNANSRSSKNTAAAKPTKSPAIAKNSKRGQIPRSLPAKRGVTRETFAAPATSSGVSVVIPSESDVTASDMSEVIEEVPSYPAAPQYAEPRPLREADRRADWGQTFQQFNDEVEPYESLGNL